jgi:hypothetical protein
MKYRTDVHLPDGNSVWALTGNAYFKSQISELARQTMVFVALNFDYTNNDISKQAHDLFGSLGSPNISDTQLFRLFDAIREQRNDFEAPRREQ